jgi:hypothetical protein
MDRAMKVFKQNADALQGELDGFRSKGGQKTFRQQTIEHADHQADNGQADKR